MKKANATYIAIILTLFMVSPAFADSKERYRQESQGYHHDKRVGYKDKISRDRDYSYQRSYKRDDFHRRDYRRKTHDHRDYRFGYREYRRGHSDGYRSHRYVQQSRPYYWRDRHHHTRVFYYGDNDWYKWIAGSYLIGELIHHLHDGRVCYDRH